jgi:hypothetical protein
MYLKSDPLIIFFSFQIINEYGRIYAHCINWKSNIEVKSKGEVG